jgi:hypothetical protein
MRRHCSAGDGFASRHLEFAVDVAAVPYRQKVDDALLEVKSLDDPVVAYAQAIPL